MHYEEQRPSGAAVCAVFVAAMSACFLPYFCLFEVARP